MREHTGTSVAIALVAATLYAVWAYVLVIVLWLSLTIYAIVKWIGAPTDHASPLTVLLVMVCNVTVFVVLVALGIYLIGKPMRPGKRARRDAEQLALSFPSENR
jgi:Kef-type K+ transport system membrane component KefB